MHDSLHRPPESALVSTNSQISDGNLRALLSLALEDPAMLPLAADLLSQKDLFLCCTADTKVQPFVSGERTKEYYFIVGTAPDILEPTLKHCPDTKLLQCEGKDVLSVLWEMNFAGRQQDYRYALRVYFPKLSSDQTTARESLILPARIFASSDCDNEKLCLVSPEEHVSVQAQDALKRFLHRYPEINRAYYAETVQNKVHNGIIILTSTDNDSECDGFMLNTPALILGCHGFDAKRLWSRCVSDSSFDDTNCQLIYEK